ncbi:E3 ubiquitin-protein ligase TRIM56-like [Diadema antillarum]|uniref:E3 ubiquitin-protein ligase TRIM56-like n=1 Tax=Diadema antillarum TaxID=105358 RepID=UPI003A89ECAF
MAAAEQTSTDESTCPICRDDLSEPKMLSCIHTCCQECLVRLHNSQGRGENISCPVCRTVCPVPGGDVSNLTTKQTTDRPSALNVSFTRCSLCDVGEAGEAALAEIYCQNCAKPICPSCLATHNSLYEEAGHKVVTLQQVESGEEKIRSPCEEHSQELKEFVCLDCRKYLCVLCRLPPDHEGHTVVESKDLEENLEADLGHLKSRVDDNVDDITEYLEYLDHVKETQVTDAIEAQKLRIDEVYQECVDRLKSVRDTLCQECNQFKETLSKELDDEANFQRMVLESIGEQASAVEKLTETALLQQSIPDESPRQDLEKMLDNVYLDHNKLDEISRRASDLKFYPSREIGNVADLHLGTVEAIQTDNA